MTRLTLYVSNLILKCLELAIRITLSISILFFEILSQRLLYVVEPVGYFLLFSYYKIEMLLDKLIKDLVGGFYG